MTSNQKIQSKVNLRDYKDLIETIAKVEYQKFSTSHLIELPELINIGNHTLYILFKNHSPENYNNTYLSTAIKWAIRNEVRRRYKWYSLKHKPDDQYDEEEAVEGMDMQKAKVREAVYETILSIDGLAAAASDNDSPFDFLKDPHAQPDENAEITEMGRMIREAIAKLPPKERTVVEYRFYRNMQVKDIAKQVGLSSSRVTRIVQASLNTVKEYLNSHEQYGY